jgi:hypothetical protein
LLSESDISETTAAFGSYGVQDPAAKPVERAART